MDLIEKEWERRQPVREVSVEEAQRAIGPLTSLRPFTRGKANTNLLVTRPSGQRQVLRLYQRDPRSLGIERRVLQRVRDLPVPQMLDSGTLDDGTLFALTTFCEGRHPDGPDGMVQEVALARALGAVAARIHSRPFPELGLLSEEGYTRTFSSLADSFSDLISWSLAKGGAGRRLPETLRRSLESFVGQAERRLAPAEASPCLVHGDFKYSNLLIDGDAVVTGILDWEFACALVPLLDIAILTRHCNGSAFLINFERGYRQEGGELPTDWVRLARQVDLMNLVGFLNGGGERPVLHAAVIERIATTLADLPT